MPYVTDIEIIFQNIRRKAPKIHCLTNPVTMQDVANLLLAAGGSAVMGQNEKEVAEITGFCQGTLLNTGVPDESKINACILAGKKANELKHPVVLDPVGIGASKFRQKAIKSAVIRKRLQSSVLFFLTVLLPAPMVELKVPCILPNQMSVLLQSKPQISFRQLF